MPKFALGSGVNTKLDPAAVGVTIADENQELFSEGMLTPVAAINPASGPQGAFAGFALADGSAVYFCGHVDESSESVELQAVILEDAQGNLIMMQENLLMHAAVDFGNAPYVWELDEQNRPLSLFGPSGDIARFTYRGRCDHGQGSERVSGLLEHDLGDDHLARPGLGTPAGMLVGRTAILN